jgi:dolichol-phosphate mannosyltransferase
MASAATSETSQPHPLAGMTAASVRERPRIDVDSIGLSVIVPTRDERGNVAELLSRVERATGGLSLEVIFIDDSTDGTADVVRAVRGRYPFTVHVIERPPERRNGLGKAVVEGMVAARHPWICVLDGDLQHPPEVIPQLLEHAFATGADLVAASRLTHGGSTEGLSAPRAMISRTLASASRLLFSRRLAHVSDPLTGFFLLKRSAIEPSQLQPEGFKILLEVLIRSPGLRTSEVPFEFAERTSGTSKACPHEAFLLLRQMVRLGLSGQRRLLRFLAVGATGIVVNSLAMAAFTEFLGLYYLVSALLATQVSSLWNFELADHWVFADRAPSRRPWVRLAVFMALNNLMLAIRAPLLALLVIATPLHYLVANVLSLLAIALVRYAVSDRVIWLPPRVLQASGTSAPAPLTNRVSPRGGALS